jgi:hypothetical protein
MTLQGIMFPDEQLPREQWSVTVKQIVMWVLVDDIIRTFVINTTD